MLAIHPNARTTPAVRAEIARSHESSGVLAQRFGVSAETIRKGRKRGPQDCQDRSARPPKLRDRDGVLRKRSLSVAIDRASRFVHLAVKDDETTVSAVVFLEAALAALPFQVTHGLTDR